MLIQANDKTTKEVKYFGLIYFQGVDGVSINTISESTDKIAACCKEIFLVSEIKA